MRAITNDYRDAQILNLGSAGRPGPYLVTQTGVAPNANPPVEWSETKNIRWKVALPGKGHSTPVIWGQRVFLTTAIPYGEALPPKKSSAPGTVPASPRAISSSSSPSAM